MTRLPIFPLLCCLPPLQKQLQTELSSLIAPALDLASRSPLDAKTVTHSLCPLKIYQNLVLFSPFKSNSNV
jgi:hypothetical protein